MSRASVLGSALVALALLGTGCGRGGLGDFDPTGPFEGDTGDLDTAVSETGDDTDIIGWDTGVDDTDIIG
ncbi:MAG: hypothetical protein HYV09_24525, partial [Deltaproteobacteria bacterium]|nr:hypothetical protein [Deltaproteobacteria bacterium]